MSIRISPAKISIDQEKRIIKNLILNDEYAKAIIPITEAEYFDSAYCKTIFIWLKEYFKQYGSSPKKLISDIYNVKKAKLSPEDSELISDFLVDLSTKFEIDEKTNVQYLIDSTISYIEKQSFIKLGESIQSNAKLNRGDECQKLVRDFKKISAITSGCINPEDEEFVKKTIDSREVDLLFKIPGPLGTLVKPERGRLVALLAPPKTGKTFLLHEFGVLARMNRLKVFECNCEMSATKINMRDLKRLTGLGDEEKTHRYSVPDCKKNQFGICQKKERENKIVLINSSGEMPEFGFHDQKYKPCTICRGTSDFELSFWFEEMHKDKLTVDAALKANRAFGLMYGSGNYRLKCYPKFSATVEDIINDLDALEFHSDFVPDVLIVDYADLLVSKYRNQDVRHQLDEIWKTLGRIATERNILVLTASQTNRTGAAKKNIAGGDIAENFMKIAHLDSMIFLQATPEEKRNGLLRISVGYNRDGDADSGRQVMVFQNLATGQPFLDSEWCSGYSD